MKKGSISIAILISLIVLLSGVSIINLALNEKHRSKDAYERVENRYIAESGIDMAIGLFISYLDNQDYALSYHNIEGIYSVTDIYSPYLLHEIQESESIDNVSLALIEQETNDYLSSIGFLDFSRDGGVEVSLRTMNDMENFKLSRLCTDPGFVVSRSKETTKVQSSINPIYLTVKSKYKGGEVLCEVQISNIYAVRKPFTEILTGETASVNAWIDVSQAKAEYQNYQNYRVRNGGV